MIWRLWFLPVVCWLFQALTLAGHAAQPRPNIIFIVVDDLGYGEPGCYGGQEIPTPNIDALAAQGVRFTNGYVTAPFCAASRAALLTGRYQTRFGFEFNPIGAKNAAPGIGLPQSEKTLAEHLQDAGYATGLVGKWHLGGTADFHPQRRGFDEFFGFLHEGHYYVPQPWNGVTSWLRRKRLPDGGLGRWKSANGHTWWSTHMGSNEPDYDADNPLLRSSQPIDEPLNLTTAFTREACDFIRRHREQPFFLYLAYNAVHSPLQADRQTLQRFDHIDDIHRRIFAAMLSDLDAGLGQVLNSLRQCDIADNTLIVFLSDNGGPTRETTSSNRPLRGGKGELWEGGIRVPFIASWHNHLPLGRVVDIPVASLDATATALRAAGIEPPPDVRRSTARLDGIDLVGMLSDVTSQPATRPLFWRVGNKQAVRVENWKLIGDGQQWQLYDLTRDIHEETNLASQEPARVQAMSSLWNAWNAEQAEPLWR